MHDARRPPKVAAARAVVACIHVVRCAFTGLASFGSASFARNLIYKENPEEVPAVCPACYLQRAAAQTVLYQTR